MVEAEDQPEDCLSFVNCSWTTASSCLSAILCVHMCGPLKVTHRYAHSKNREIFDFCMHFGQSEPSSLSVTMGRLFVGTSGWCGLHPKDFARHYDVVRAPGEPMGAGDARR